MMSSIRIVVADDHPAFSGGLRRLLEIESDLKVIGQANNAADVIQRVRELKPDILLLDLRMPLQPKAEISPRGGLDALASVDRGSITKTTLFAAEMETPEIVEAIELGVRGVILKSAATESLIKSIRSVISGSCWMLGEASVLTPHPHGASLKGSCSVPAPSSLAKNVLSGDITPTMIASVRALK